MVKADSATLVAQTSVEFSGGSLVTDILTESDKGASSSLSLVKSKRLLRILLKQSIVLYPYQNSIRQIDSIRSDRSKLLAVRKHALNLSDCCVSSIPKSLKTSFRYHCR